MTDINHVVLVGRLTRNAELKYTNSGMAILNFSVANNQYQGRDKDDYVNFFECQIWSKQAEGVNDYLIKGKQVVISGELKQQRWEQGGNKRSKVIINVGSIQLIGAKGEADKRSDAGFKDDISGEGDIPF